MSYSRPNLFISLFQWRPVDGRTPGENFLTEAFVYCLRRNATFRTQWLREILSSEVIDADLRISTRESHVDDERETTIYPDIDIRGVLASGQPFCLLVEVKWGARYDHAQIAKYDRLIAGQPNAHLVFLSANSIDCRNAKAQCVSLASAFHVFEWQQIYSLLAALSQDCQSSQELVEFMRMHGLSPPEPISQTLLQSYVATRDFTKRLRRYCEKLLNELPWDFLPLHYRDATRQEVKDQYGRVAIVFHRHDWNGTITIGFLYSNQDHRVKFADGSDTSVDLMMRIEAHPGAVGRTEVVSALQERANEVRQCGGVVRLAGDRDNQNPHTLFIAQRSLSEFLDNPDERAQLLAMHKQIGDWSAVLFKGGELEAALKRFDPIG
ncbi:PD-(D/E)XK nuclease family protein [Rhizobium bangladeshense]|uniref:PD-(D/E)XK nuclease family protein n=1 Tax=Rhizobium bangladeshense TaxID=1138189 RepID=UPI001C9165A7|nr:PD-(D/E)XK nuclease family protein [Rhizobium bangladeshense]MBY3595990.1 PD-(D/E)XK nuclease family protein [Rhizobium bangladeshense]